jgi:uracil-DNA glycosylase family 4
MVINNPVKGEREHLLNEGTQYFLKKVKEFGFKQQDFYYTGPVKCFVEKGKTVTKECEGRCFDLLREEIKAVQPKLILCCASNVLSMFANGKPSMGKLHGEVVFNKEFNAYVLFSFSPQYAYFKEEIAPKFYEAMTTLGDIFA